MTCVLSSLVLADRKTVILSNIQNTKANFDVSSSGLVSLTQAKVPQDVIRVMFAKFSGSE